MLTKKIIILSFAFLLSCSSIVTNLNENSWAESVIKKMTLREKIAQMMVYRMNMHYVNFENKDVVRHPIVNAIVNNYGKKNIFSNQE